MKTNLHQRGIEMAETGLHGEALACIREHLLHFPDDSCALNDAGVVLYALGEYEQAVAHLRAAADILGTTNTQVLWNLCEVYLASGKPEEAAGLFDLMEQTDLLTPELANRTATCFLESGDLGGAVEALLSSLRICPDQDVLVSALDVIRSKRAKIAFFSQNCATRSDEDMKFLSGVFDYIVARFEAHVLYDPTAEQITEMLRWCDIAWFDRYIDLRALTADLPKACGIIIRLADPQELLRAADTIRWEGIDTVVTTTGTDGDFVDLIAHSVKHLDLGDRSPASRETLRRINGLLCEMERLKDPQMS